MRKQITLYLVLLILIVARPLWLHAQCGSCGDGTEGAFNATNNTTIAGGVHNFSSFTIAPGVTVRATGTAPLEILVTGNVDIQGTLDVSGLPGSDGVTYVNGGAGAVGVAGGGNGGAGSFDANNGPFDGFAASGPGAGGIGSGWSGGGGAGYALAGGASGGVGGAAGPSYGNAQITGNNGGSGGGGGSGGYNCGAGGGGAGGGFVLIRSCGTITISGTINANGGNGGSDGTGNCGGGGGGSGGGILLSAVTVTNNGTLVANGGPGGASAIPGTPYFGVGGAGSVGRIAIEANTFNGSGTSQPTPGSIGPFTSGSTVVANTSGTDVSCFGANDGSAICVASGGNGLLNYSWSTGSTTATQTNLGPGCYYVTVTDTVGCSATDSICITEPTEILISNTINSVLCFGDCDGSILSQAIGGTPGYTYLWSNGSTTQAVSGLCAGSYALTVTDSDGCQAIATSIEIVSPTAISLSETHQDATTTTSMDGSATVTASGGTPGYTYLWSPSGATTPTISNLGPGFYEVVVTDSNGCQDTLTVSIGVLIGMEDVGSIDVSVFPNPTTGLLTVRAQMTTASPMHVEVLDALGKLVLRREYESTTDLQATLDLSALADGIYQMRLMTEGGSAVRRITIHK